uniref:AlNc14C184G8278 protein n=1 Tax=Albugo laibachii Nc14 TaxID=890382 RepID=F0WPD3_9STRA|nr:AlNc14C184G8278 [Albugo laibachii Nc14]|eukprot:CCA23180.1 AlNc14C184G8278 [Albugo laibachii Nc14]
MKIEELTDGTEHLTLKLRHNRLTVEEKSAPVMELLEGSKNVRLEHGTLKDASEKWNVNVHTVYRVWKRYCNQRANSTTRGITFECNACSSGRKGASDDYIKDLHDQISKLNIEQRGDLRSLSAALAIPTTTLQTIRQEQGDARPHSHTKTDTV